MGTFAVRVPDAVPLPPSTERLIAFLALEERRITREVAAARLWDRVPAAKAAGALRTCLWRVGRCLPDLIRADRDRISLASAFAVDVNGARNFARRSIADPNLAADADVGAFEKDLLPDWYDDWAVLERERYRQLRLHALEAVARGRSAQGRHAEAIDAAGTAVAAEPLRESAHVVLIEAHLAEGNVVEARRAWAACRSHLASELGVNPSPRLRELAGRLGTCGVPSA